MDGKFTQHNKRGPGKPKGFKNKVTLLREAMDNTEGDEGLEIRRTVIQQAKDGDRPSQKIVLDRTWPVPKGNRIKMDIPPVTGINDIMGVLNTTADQLLNGWISDVQAKAVMDYVEGYRRMHDEVIVGAKVQELQNIKGDNN